jgi:7,8-dihydroneopterin aldolase/epimerase/oxygenase
VPDRILLNSIDFYGYHGVSDEERRIGHHFSVDVCLEIDLAAAGRSDDLKQTVDYGDVCRRVLAIGQGPPVRLLERLAARLAACCLREFAGVDAVEIAVRKRLPPLPANLPAVEVRIRRTRREAPDLEEA